MTNVGKSSGRLFAVHLNKFMQRTNKTDAKIATAGSVCILLFCSASGER